VFSIDGLASGFDTTKIIESLLGFQQQRIDSFNARKAEVTTEQTSFKGIEAQLLTLQSSLRQLNRSANSVFDARVATSSNDEVITATAGSRAIASTYQLSVEQLATAQQIASQGFEGSTAQVATGEITFKVGNRAEQSIVIDGSNNTLEGFVSTINEQVEDVNASLIFDQASNSYRVLLSSRLTGADNTIAVTSSQDAATGTVPDFSGPEVQAASNAVIRLGSGAGALTAEYDSNTIDGLIDNVTLELGNADPGVPVTIDIQPDIEKATEAVQSFVDDFNSIVDFIGEQTRYNPETEEASPLLGNRSAATIKNQLLTVVSNTVPGADLGRLSEIGIDLDTKGRLSVESDTLTQALKGELEGVDAEQVRGLFGLNATSTSSGVRFLGGSGRTEPSETAYQVDIIQAAEQAQITATGALAASTVIDASNRDFEITVDGILSEPLTLQEGTYTSEELASHLQSVINSSSELGVHRVSVSVDSSNQLVIQTEAYGSAAGLSSVTGTAASAIGFAGTESDTGQDVAGNFIVDGVSEAARGTGQILMGDPDNENTADLRLQVTLGAAQVGAGVESELTVTEGITGRLNDYINQVLDSNNGLLKTVNESFELRIASIDRSIEKVEELTETKRQSLLEEFAALETTINDLQATGNFISSQLTSMGSFSAGALNQG
jgi:flagellar hook-associated protein 2